MNKTSLSFNDYLDFQNFENRNLWKFAENYLDVIGNKRYKVSEIQHNNVKITSTVKKPHLANTVLAVIRCAILLPVTLTALAIKAFYRKQYSFKVIDFADLQIKPKLEQHLNATNQTTNPVTPIQPSEVPVVKNVEENKNPIEKTALQVAYEVDIVITRIVDAKNAGRNVGIWLGRNNDQSMPTEEGWEWFSLDEMMNENANTERHLKMNFNQWAAIRKMKNLFNKVIVDYSTLKFFDRPWPLLYQLLEQNDNSELITEAYSGNIGLENHISKPTYKPETATMVVPIRDRIVYQNKIEKEYKNWKERVGENEENRLHQEFETQNPNIEKSGLLREFKLNILKKENIELEEPPSHLPELYQAIKDHVEKKYFDQVELKTGPFPYRTGLEEIHTDYWVMRKPKKLPSS